MSWQLIIIIALGAYASLATFYCLKFAILILKIQDSIEISLDKLDKRYASMDKILQRPLFYDSQEIKSVLVDIDSSREAVLEVANVISENFSGFQEKKIDEG